MAIRAHIHPENLGLPISSPDYSFMGNTNFINTTTNNNNYDNLVYNGCGLNEFSYNNLQHKLLEQQQFQQQQYMVHLQDMKRRNSSVFLQPSKKQKLATNLAITTTTATASSTTTSESDNHMSMNLSQSLSVQLEKQRHEIDRFIVLQNERLKLVLQEQRKQQLRVMFKKFEAKAVQLLKQKDDEIAEARNKTMELQEIMRKMDGENQTWQRVASENEAIVFSLNNTLEQLKQQQQGCSSSSSNDVDDAESCCNFFYSNKNTIRGKEETCEGFVAEIGESRGVFGFVDRVTAAAATTTTTKGLLCKVCNAINACVLLLPCRHLCCCKVCDGLLDACPVCKSPKMASVEALFS